MLANKTSYFAKHHATFGLPELRQAEARLHFPVTASAALLAGRLAGCRQWFDELHGGRLVPTRDSGLDLREQLESDVAVLCLVEGVDARGECALGGDEARGASLLVGMRALHEIGGVHEARVRQHRRASRAEAGERATLLAEQLHVARGHFGQVRQAAGHT